MCFIILTFYVCTFIMHLLVSLPYHPIGNIQVMVTVWRLRGNIIRTAPCWVV